MQSPQFLELYPEKNRSCNCLKNTRKTKEDQDKDTCPGDKQVSDMFGQTHRDLLMLPGWPFKKLVGGEFEYLKRPGKMVWLLGDLVTIGVEKVHLTSILYWIYPSLGWYWYCSSSILDYIFLKIMLLFLQVCIYFWITLTPCFLKAIYLNFFLGMDSPPPNSLYDCLKGLPGLHLLDCRLHCKVIMISLICTVSWWRIDEDYEDEDIVSTMPSS